MGEDPSGTDRDVELDAGDATRFVLVRGHDGSVVGLRRAGAGGREVWSTEVDAPLANTAALLAAGDRLYAALYSDIASGCEVVGVDAQSGKLVWRTRLRGLGALHHSKYRNDVKLDLRGGSLVISADEAAGNYVEVLDPEHGTILSSERVP